jgi:hypothetical protein
MVQRKYFVLGSVIIYVILIAIFISSRDKNAKREADNPKCEREKVCLNFCCKDETCNQTYIDENFNFSSFKASKTHWVVSRKVVAEFNKPKCTMQHVTDHDWSFSHVSLCQGKSKSEIIVSDFRMVTFMREA